MEVKISKRRVDFEFPHGNFGSPSFSQGISAHVFSFLTGNCANNLPWEGPVLRSLTQNIILGTVWSDWSRDSNQSWGFSLEKNVARASWQFCEGLLNAQTPVFLCLVIFNLGAEN